MVWMIWWERNTILLEVRLDNEAKGIVMVLWPHGLKDGDQKIGGVGAKGKLVLLREDPVNLLLQLTIHNHHHHHPLSGK